MAQTTNSTKGNIPWWWVALPIAVIGAVVGGSLLRRKARSFEVDRQNGMIITRPKAKTRRFPALIVYGGLDPYNGDWMRQMMPDKVSTKYVIIYAPKHNTNFQDVRQALSDYRKKHGLRFSSESIIGFSAGALQVQRVYHPLYEKVVLIDPSTRSSLADKDYGRNVQMIYNRDNWKSLPTVYGSIDDLADEVDRDGLVIETSRPHLDIAKFALERMV